MSMGNMAEEANKQPIGSDLPLPSLGVPPSDPIKPRNRLRKPLITVGIFMAIILAAFAGWYVLKNSSHTKLKPDVLAKVDNKEITKKDVQQRLWVKVQFAGQLEEQDIKSPKAQENLDELVEQAIIEQESTKLGISNQKSDVEKYMKDQGFVAASYLTDQQKQLLLEYHKSGYLKNAISNKVIEWKELAYVKIPVWIRYFIDNEAYKKDVEYGKQLGEQIYNDWQAGKIDYAGAVKRAEDDPRLGRATVSELHGLKYLAFGNQVDRASYQAGSQVDFQKLLLSLKKGYNPPVALVTKVNNLSSNNTGSSSAVTEESIIVAHVTSANDTSKVFASYADWLKDVSAKHKVVRK